MKSKYYFKFLYECGPTDWWENFVSFEEYLEKVEGTNREINERIKLLMEACYIAAKNSYWEGDVREGPFIAGLPGECGEPETLIIFKQDNNGTTFLLSPIELSYLKEAEKRIEV